MEYTFIDAFSGAGGLGVGLSAAGLSPVLSFDNDKLSIDTMILNEHSNKHKILLADARKLSIDEILEAAGLEEGELFLFTGGPPCQGFSVQRRGEDYDARSDLVNIHTEIAMKLKPKFFMIENVPAIQGKRGQEILGVSKALLKQNGYHWSEAVLDAQDFSVPQRRKRFVLIAIRGDIYHGPFKFPAPHKKKMTVRDAIDSLPPPPSDGKDHSTIPNHRSDKLSEKNLKRIRYLKPGQGRQHLPENLLIAAHKKGTPEKIGHRNVYGRMDWDSVAPTLTARFDSFTRGQFGHPVQDRSISLREGAALQTFPDSYKFVGTKVEVARQIGNAVPPQLAKAIGLSLKDYYDKQ